MLPRYLPQHPGALNFSFSFGGAGGGGGINSKGLLTE